MEGKLNKRDIAKIAKSRIKEGMSKQAVYEQLVDEYRQRVIIADVLSGLPTPARLKKYGPLNLLFLTLLIFFTSLFVLYPTIAIIWPLWLIYVVAFRKMRLYYFNTLLGAIVAICGIGICLYQRQLVMATLGFTALAGVLLMLGGIGLPRLLAPMYKEVKEEVTDADGGRRFVVRHYFPD